MKPGDIVGLLAGQYVHIIDSAQQHQPDQVSHHHLSDGQSYTEETRSHGQI
jgi:hypothetical protein